MVHLGGDGQTVQLYILPVLFGLHWRQILRTNRSRRSAAIFSLYTTYDTDSLTLTTVHGDDLEGNEDTNTVLKLHCIVSTAYGHVEDAAAVSLMARRVLMVSGVTLLSIPLFSSAIHPFV